MIEDNERKLKSIPKCPDSVTFALYFLDSFDFPTSTIERLKEQLAYNCRAVIGKQIELFLAKKGTGSLAYEHWLRSHGETRTRFVLFLDDVTFIAQDLKGQDKISDSFSKIGQYFEFFLPLLNLEAKSFTLLGKPDIKAGEEIAHIRFSRRWRCRGGRICLFGIAAEEAPGQIGLPSWD